MAKPGRPRKNPQGSVNSMTPSQRDDKLVEMESIDRLLDAKKTELEEIQIKFTNLETQVFSLDNKIQIKKAELEQKSDLKREEELEKLVNLRNDLEVKEKHFQALEEQYSARNAMIEQKEVAAAKFEEEKKYWQSLSLQLEQRSIQIEKDESDAISFKLEYEAKLHSLNQKESKLSALAVQIETDRLFIQAQRGDVDERLRVVELREKTIEEAKKALHARIQEFTDQKVV